MSSQWIQYDRSQGSNLTDSSDTTYYVVLNKFDATQSLLKIDPTNGEILPVTEIAPGVRISNPPEINTLLGSEENCIEIDGTLYFFVRKTGVTNVELWKIDPASHTPVPVGNTDESSQIINPSNLTDVKGTLYFIDNDNINNPYVGRLWSIDVMTGNLNQVIDQNTGLQIDDISSLTNIDGTLYFSVNILGAESSELWKIDFTTGTPVQLSNNLPTGYFLREDLSSVNGNLYFTGAEPNSDLAVWKLNPSTGDLVKLHTDGLSSSLTNVNGTLYFTSYLSGLWKIDPATDSPVLVMNMGRYGEPFNLELLTNVNGTVYFSGRENTGSNLELWRIDPTTDNPTFVWDMPPDSVDFGTSVLGYSNGELYVAGDSIYPYELWAIDNPTADSVAVQLIGRNSDDRYNVNNLNDAIVEGENGGIDTVYANISGYTLPDNVERLYLEETVRIGKGNLQDNALYGNQWDNFLYGNDGNDYLSGGAGKDVMAGGRGDDIYDVDNLNDVVIEYGDDRSDLEGGGIDEVYASVSGYTLPNYVERLRLYDHATSGTGNEFDNSLYGNNLNDTLDGKEGNDYIYGGAGNDTMIGGLGNDIYDVDNLNDAIVENTNEGIDEVYASFSGYTLGDHLEVLRLYGIATSGTGNTLNNSLYGNNLNDTLDGKEGNDYIYGGAGNDTLIGGLGDDIYDVDNLNDAIVENIGEGIDEVYASFSGYTLGDHLEVLRLYNDAASGNGNALDNTLYGNHLDDTLNGGAGNDILIGGAGNDILTGGSGNDIFLFRADACLALSSAGIDTITDFTVGEDKIQLGQSIFSSLTTSVGTLSADEFSIVMSDVDAETSTAAIVYNSSNGKLFYNADLTAPGLGTNGGQFAQLASGLVLTNNQFEAIG